MAGEPTPHAPISAVRLFPALRLVPAVSEAADPKRLLLAALGLLLLLAGREGLDRLFPASGAIEPTITFTRVGVADDLHSAPWRVTEPVRALVGPFFGVFLPRAGGVAFLHALLSALWGVLVWSLLGGAIARVAVVQSSRGERVGLPGALRFAARKAGALLMAPTSPLLAAACFAAFCAGFGLLYRIPGAAGPTIAGALAFLPLLAGLMMALILVGLAVGWPLMIASVAAESEDGFDALSRAYAYVQQRPVIYAAYLAIAWGLGIAGLAFVDVFARMVVELTAWGLSFGAPGDRLAALFNPGIEAQSTAVTLHAFWLSAVALIARAWIYSYFWTSAASIYLLLRRDVDGTPRFDIALADRAALAPVAAAEEPAEAG